jgi:hypothetical protein
MIRVNIFEEDGGYVAWFSNFEDDPDYSVEVQCKSKSEAEYLASTLETEVDISYSLPKNLEEKRAGLDE